MWRGPFEAFSHHSCSLSLTTVALCPHTRLLPCIPVSKPWDDINRWTVLVLMNKSQQGGNIKFSNTESNMTEIITAVGCIIRMWFYLAQNNLCRFFALKLLSPLMFFLSFFHNNTHLKTFSQLPPPHQISLQATLPTHNIA